MPQSINPANEEVLATFDEHSAGDIEEALADAEKAARRQRGIPLERRAEMMGRVANVLDERKEEWGRLITSEMGKPLAAAIAEVAKCASVCRYYADNGPKFLSDRTYESDASRSFVRHLPLGPVLAVMPWNFPFWQAFRFAAPALVAGNVAILKHASNVPQSALAIEQAILAGGFETGSFKTLLIGSEKVEGLLKDHRIKAATLTGSEGAGRAVAATSGGEIKPTVLELGGSDPFIVMPSADLDKALDAAVTGRTLNNGQSCIAAKRFLLHSDIHDAFLERFRERFEGLTVGDPMEEATDIGPLAMADIRDELDAQVRDSVTAGAKRLCGADAMRDGKGYYFKPGILTDIPKNSPAYHEELFGPVALIFKVDSIDEAIETANATRFGLGSAIFTEDEGEQQQAASEIDAGATFVNQIVASDPRLPFGGVKASGYGRELSDLGIREFVNQKTISIA